ncbi:MAG TPA: Flp family type IVb pilin [Nitrolancea sp.]|nr:Flp family type IVb pilin [Nitrolancea sp.]
MVEYITALYGLYAPETKTKLEGQGMVEYALILVLVSIVAIITLRVVGTSISGIFSSISSTLGTAS